MCVGFVSCLDKKESPKGQDNHCCGNKFYGSEKLKVRVGQSGI